MWLAALTVAWLLLAWAVIRSAGTVDGALADLDVSPLEGELAQAVAITHERGCDCGTCRVAAAAARVDQRHAFARSEARRRVEDRLAQAAAARGWTAADDQAVADLLDGAR